MLIRNMKIKHYAINNTQINFYCNTCLYFFEKITTLLISVLTVIETPIIFFGFTDDLSCDYCDMVMMFSDVL